MESCSKYFIEQTMTLVDGRKVDTEKTSLTEQPKIRGFRAHDSIDIIVYCRLDF